jgi:hypothetical protein
MRAEPHKDPEATANLGSTTQLGSTINIEVLMTIRQGARSGLGSVMAQFRLQCLVS